MVIIKLFDLCITLLISLGLTLFFELLFALITHKRNAKDYLLICLVNVITNPVVVLAYMLLTSYTNWYPVFIIIPLETLAVLVEAFYYKTYGLEFKHPFYFSLGANVFSYSIGFVLNIIF
ncbi:hypothetical protein RBG61_12760 [Paludicola sp. MB14-C6]|uniref:hypothetical protein n=1 Tax=Paludihabitans sp. MB14-C6 TaxID=3070656 RepID=UPI0027DB108E|nr:hypothetical protein [Paludicola sp. MB14-C6]WMJ22848.1 hypothetical protein RBG61_12760 [Paludicola sp. MB14-C6]